MDRDERGEVTRVLDSLRGADRRAVFDSLLPLVYDELRVLAESRLAKERAGHSLQATGLVHDAYMRMLAADGPSWNDRRHFFHAAAQAMRWILVDHARKRGRAKRGGERVQVTLGQVGSETEMSFEEIVAINDAVERLQDRDSRAAEVVHLRYFAGLSVAETAKAMDLSERTVKREWAVARALLYAHLSTQDA